jgi:hypothetical protein
VDFGCDYQLIFPSIRKMDFPNTEEKPQHPTLLCEIDDHSGDRDFYSSNGYAIFEPFWAPWPSYIAPLRVLEGAVIEPHVIIKQVPEHTNIVSKTEWILPGTLDGAAVDAYPDTGSCVNAIPLEFARKQGWLIRSRPNLSKVKLPANRSVRPLGVVTLPWRFSGETTVYNVEFLVLRKCIYRVILGQEFLISSKSLDILHYRRRFKKKRVYSERRKRLCFLGSSFDKARGAFNGHTAWVLADTGSDVMVVSRQYAVSHNFDIEAGDDFREELEFADGYVRRADGMVLNAEWSFGKGSRKYRDNFFVLDGIDADIILSNSFLFRNRILSTPGLFGSSVHGGQTAPFDSPRLNLIKYLNNRLPQSSDSSHSGMRSILF